MYQGGEGGKPHDEDNCEMCQDLGYNCREYEGTIRNEIVYVEEPVHDDDDDASVYSEASTISRQSSPHQDKDEDITPTQSDNEEGTDEIEKALGRLKLSKKK